LPVSGETWQVMRLSRNRNWGHPALVEFIEELSGRAAHKGWPGLLIGDMSQPRGGPMLNGHASHQVGLDVDIWLTPMPDHQLTGQEREEMMATVVVANDRKDVDRKVWTRADVALIKAAAEDPRVNRIFVNTAIKKALCRDAGGAGDRTDGDARAFAPPFGLTGTNPASILFPSLPVARRENRVAARRTSRQAGG
jgi:penicillin-insensitive murein endopeptidase